MKNYRYAALSLTTSWHNLLYIWLGQILFSQCMTLCPALFLVAKQSSTLRRPWRPSGISSSTTSSYGGCPCWEINYPVLREPNRSSWGNNDDHIEKAGSSEESNYFTLKGLSHQIRFAWKWYGSLGLGKDMWRWTLKFFFTLPLILYRLLKFLCDPH